LPKSKSSNWLRGVLSAALLALVAISWVGNLDLAARDATVDNFKRALAVAAIARAFNGVISVAQGTEVAIQPVGIGVTLTVGEILDPLNDLVERFSMLALLASVSLGMQITLSNMLATPWLSAVLSVTVLGYLLVLWRDRTHPGTARFAARCVATLVFARFILIVMLLTTHWIDAAFLQESQAKAMSNLERTSGAIEELQTETDPVRLSEEENGFLDRTSAQLRGMLDSSRQTLDLRAQLKRLEDEVATSVEEIINLIVIFLLQTLLLPLLALWLSWWLLRGIWNWTGPDIDAPAEPVRVSTAGQ